VKEEAKDENHIIIMSDVEDDEEDQEASYSS
jgi:hypothetical protein